MRIRPIAMGMDVVPTLIRSKAAFTPGKIAPIATPAAIARKIQSVRKRSRNESLRRGGACAIEIVALIRESPVWVVSRDAGKSPLSLGSIRKFDSADFPDPLLQRETVERLDSQARENLDSIFQLEVNAEEEAAPFFVCPLKRHRVGHAPVRSDRLSRPQWTLLGGGPIADREDEVERRTVRTSKLVPTLAAQV